MSNPPDHPEEGSLPQAPGLVKPSDVVPSDASSEESAPWAVRLNFYCVLCALCPLIPIPFLDDVVLGALRKRLAREQLAELGLRASPKDIEVLVAEPSGCGLGCLGAVVLYPLSKIFKKVFFFLSIKDCADVASLVFHRGYLLQVAGREGALTQQMLEGAKPSAALVSVRAAIDQTCSEVDTRPMHQILRRLFAGSRALMRGSARKLAALVRKTRKGKDVEEALVQNEGQAEEVLGGLLTSFRREVWSQTIHLRTLEETFARQLQEQRSQDEEG